MTNESKLGKNEKSRANLKRFGIEKPATPGPGRPRLPENLKADLKEAKAILNDYSAFAAERLVQLATSPFGNVAIQACRSILEKTIPTIEEVHDNRPQLADWSPEILRKLAEGSTGKPQTNGHTGNGVSA